MNTNDKNQNGQSSKKTPLSTTLELMTTLPKGSSFYAECSPQDAIAYKARWNKPLPLSKRINIKTEKHLAVNIKSLQPFNIIKISII